MSYFLFILTDALFTFPLETEVCVHNLSSQTRILEVIKDHSWRLVL